MHILTRRATAPLAVAAVLAVAACSPRRPALANGPAAAPQVIPETARRGTSTEVALVRHGEVIGRITTEWSATKGGTPVRRKLLTLYREGMPPRTFELPNADVPADGSLRRLTPIARTVSFAGSTPAFNVGGGGCDEEFEAMSGAIGGYWAAEDALGSCLTTPLGCFGASMELAGAWYGLVASEGRLSNCLMT